MTLIRVLFVYLMLNIIDGIIFVRWCAKHDRDVIVGDLIVELFVGFPISVVSFFATIKWWFFDGGKDQY